MRHPAELIILLRILEILPQRLRLPFRADMIERHPVVLILSVLGIRGGMARNTPEIGEERAAKGSIFRGRFGFIRSPERHQIRRQIGGAWIDLSRLKRE